MNSDEKNILIESEPPQEEYRTRNLYDLHKLTKDKSLLLYNKKERFHINTAINKTLLNLAHMHCSNEGIDFGSFLETVLIDFMKRNKIILCRVMSKQRPIDKEARQARGKRLKQFNRALREMRGLRTIIKKVKPKREKRTLRIESRKDFITGEN